MESSPNNIHSKGGDSDNIHTKKGSSEEVHTKKDNNSSDNFHINLHRRIPTLEQIQNDPESVELSTAPFDPRFPNANQTKNCWQNYVDFHLCQAAKGPDYSPCQYFKRNYKILCPQNWVSKWDELKEEGKFAADLTPPSVDELIKMTGHD